MTLAELAKRARAAIRLGGITHLASEGVSTEAFIGEVEGRQWLPFGQRWIDLGEPVTELTDTHLVIVVPCRQGLFFDRGLS